MRPGPKLSCCGREYSANTCKTNFYNYIRDSCKIKCDELREDYTCGRREIEREYFNIDKEIKFIVSITGLNVLDVNRAVNKIIEHPLPTAYDWVFHKMNGHNKMKFEYFCEIMDPIALRIKTMRGPFNEKIQEFNRKEDYANVCYGEFIRGLIRERLNKLDLPVCVYTTTKKEETIDKIMNVLLKRRYVSFGTVFDCHFICDDCLTDSMNELEEPIINFRNNIPRMNKAYNCGFSFE